MYWSINIRNDLADKFRDHAHHHLVRDAARYSFTLLDVCNLFSESQQMMVCWDAFIANQSIDFVVDKFHYFATYEDSITMRTAVANWCKLIIVYLPFKTVGWNGNCWIVL